MGAGFAPIQNVQLADHVHNVHVERDGYLQIYCVGVLRFAKNGSPLPASGMTRFVRRYAGRLT